jgi:ribonuclease HII
VAVGVGQVEVADIDRFNIYWAAMLARRSRGAHAVAIPGPGRRQAGHQGTQAAADAEVEGDRLGPSVAAASIIAKVTRDRMMENWVKSIRVMALSSTRTTALWDI